MDVKQITRSSAIALEHNVKGDRSNGLLVANAWAIHSVTFQTVPTHTQTVAGKMPALRNLELD